MMRMIQSRLDLGGFKPPQIISPTRVVNAVGPHRLAAQDEALSRLKQRFESAWGHLSYNRLRIKGGFYFLHGNTKSNCRKSL